jgi:hypothetical protein
MYGPLFSIPENKTAIILPNYIIFCPSDEAAIDYLAKLKKKETLDQDTLYKSLTSRDLLQSANLDIFINLAKAGSLFEKYCDSNPVIEKTCFKETSSLSVFMQFSGGSNVFGNIILHSASTAQNGPIKHWQCKLDNIPSGNPIAIYNKLEKKVDILVSDVNHNIYLVSQSGTILWKKVLNEEILGQAYSIFNARFKKNEYIFNTSKELWLLDDKGKNAKGYPIRFKVPATNGIKVFDFDNNFNYRIYVALANKSVVALTTAGGKVDGWKFGKTDSPVRNEIGYYVYNGKDYLYFADAKNIYALNRRGEKRIKPKQAVRIQAEQLCGFIPMDGLKKNE